MTPVWVDGDITLAASTVVGKLGGSSLFSSHSNLGTKTNIKTLEPNIRI